MNSGGRGSYRLPPEDADRSGLNDDHSRICSDTSVFSRSSFAFSHRRRSSSSLASTNPARDDLRSGLLRLPYPIVRIAPFGSGLKHNSHYLQMGKLSIGVAPFTNALRALCTRSGLSANRRDDSGMKSSTYNPLVRRFRALWERAEQFSGNAIPEAIYRPDSIRLDYQRRYPP
jgi:hypothetical protein